MANLTGERTVEIDAPIARCFAIAADIEGAPAWQAPLRDVQVLERDGAGRPALVQTEFDAKVRAVKALLRFGYEGPTSITWDQERGDVKSLRGWWKLEDLGGDRTRASYGLDVDPGMMLGLLLRGPAEAAVRDVLLGGAADGLKRKAEAG